MDKSLSKLTKQELLAKAATLRIKTNSSMEKDEILAALIKVTKSKKKTSAKPAKKVTAKAKPVKKATATKPAKKVVAKAKPVKKATATKPAKKVVAKAKPVKKATATKPAKKVVAKAKPVKKASATKPAKKVVAKAKPVKKATAAKPAKKVMAKATPSKKVAAKKTTAPAPTPVLPSHTPGKWEIDTAKKKFFIADEQGDFEHGEGEGLPQAYGETRIVAMVPNPRQLYVYWEIHSDDAETARNTLGADWAQIGWVVRLFDVTGISFDGGNANSWFDVNIGSYERDRYIDLDRPNRAYIAVIGLMGPSFRFQAIAQSEVVHIPASGLGDSAQGEWAISDEDFARLYALAGGGRRGGSSRGAFGGISSEAFLGFGASEEMAEGRDRPFFFRLDCELTVTGATAPEAQVTMMGSDIVLNRDGTFSARFALPDGEYDIPVEAISPDGMERWEISPIVDRKTRISRGRNYDERKRA